MTAKKSPPATADLTQESDQTSPLSKTALKKEMLALQKLGEELLKLSPQQLDKIPLEETLASAIHAARKMTRRRALYRQRQYIGKLMRSTDAGPIQAALDQIRHPERDTVERFHRVETWRGQLVETDGRAATDLIDAYPNVDRQQLSQKIRAAIKEHKTGKPAGAGRALFRFIDKLLAGTAASSPNTGN